MKEKKKNFVGANKISKTTTEMLTNKKQIGQKIKE